MSGRIAKSQIPTRSRLSLPPDASFALMTAKNSLRERVELDTFRNARGRTDHEGPPLPDPSQGCVYYEVQVGKANENDPPGRTRLQAAGSRGEYFELADHGDLLHG